MIADPVLSAEERAAFEDGVADFNAGRFFECHDTLEDLWSGLRGEPRDFFQGLIQVSVGFYHLGNGNPAGASSMLGRALVRFERYPEGYFGFDLAAHRAELRLWLDRIATGGHAQHEPPKWRFEPRATSA